MRSRNRRAVRTGRLEPRCCELATGSPRQARIPTSVTRRSLVIAPRRRALCPAADRDYCAEHVDAHGNAAVQYLRVPVREVGDVGDGYGRAREHALAVLAQLPLGPLERLAERGMAAAATPTTTERAASDGTSL